MHLTSNSQWVTTSPVIRSLPAHCIYNLLMVIQKDCLVVNSSFIYLVTDLPVYCDKLSMSKWGKSNRQDCTVMQTSLKMSQVNKHKARSSLSDSEALNKHLGWTSDSIANSRVRESQKFGNKACERQDLEKGRTSVGYNTKGSTLKSRYLLRKNCVWISAIILRIIETWS